MKLKVLLVAAAAAGLGLGGAQSGVRAATAAKPAAQSYAAWKAAHPKLEAEIADLKVKTAALIAAARPGLDAKPLDQRVGSPPAIWRVAGAIGDLRDCGATYCPVMAVIPAGEFTMGSPPDEAQRTPGEVQHRVQIAYPFAVAKTMVTFDEWDACLKDGGCNGFVADDNGAGWGRGSRPVLNVNWNDAQAYIAWLNRKTGKTYRLLSEAEWEYAARGGTTTPFYTGRTISADQANYDSQLVYGDGKPGPYRHMTVPVGSFAPNPFGLYDMAGNVWQWVQDCWNGPLDARAPVDGKPWSSGECRIRVVRGGAWYARPFQLRSAFRAGFETDSRIGNDGIRLARDL